MSFMHLFRCRKKRCEVVYSTKPKRISQVYCEKRCKRVGRDGWGVAVGVDQPITQNTFEHRFKPAFNGFRFPSRRCVSPVLILIFARGQKKRSGVAVPFTCLGPMERVSYESERLTGWCGGCGIRWRGRYLRVSGGVGDADCVTTTNTTQPIILILESNVQKMQIAIAKHHWTDI